MSATEIRMIDPVLTSIAQSYRNTNFVCNHLSPIVSINHTNGKIPVLGKATFQPREIHRALRVSSNRIPIDKINYCEFEIHECDVEIPIDYLEEEESPDFLRYEQQMTRQLIDLLLLHREKEIADFVQNPSNFPAYQVITITANNAFDDYSSGADPLGIIQNALGSIRQKVARHPNVMVIEDSSYRVLMNHPFKLE